MTEHCHELAVCDHDELVHELHHGHDQTTVMTTSTWWRIRLGVIGAIQSGRACGSSIRRAVPAGVLDSIVNRPP